PGYGEEEPPPPTHEEPPPPSGEEEPPPPSEEEHTPPAPQTEQPPALAETGSEGTLGAAAAGAVLIAGGAILYRRGRALTGR
ncbi:LPXTG cell wall anchor domain-containing protein, partial [Streptomyces sp. SID5926]|nr:LPXTG cell wall anchor domain-containing protein [Streptomyces sp. SID5926]